MSTHLRGIDVNDLSEAALRAVFTDLRFESNVTPAIQIRDPFGPVNPSLVGRLVQPQITLYSPQFGPKVIAPWGAPNPASFPLTALILGLGLAGLTYFAIKGARA